MKRRVSPEAINRGNDNANDRRGASIRVTQCEHSLKQRTAIVTREIRGLAGGGGQEIESSCGGKSGCNQEVMDYVRDEV